MTQVERQVVTYHLGQLEDLLTDGVGVQEPMRLEGLMHLGAVRKILLGAHGAQSHAPRRRGRAAKPADPPGTAGPT